MNILTRHPRPQIPTVRARYEIVVEARLGRRWADWFEGFDLVDREAGQTALTGSVDQSALHAALSRIRDLGVPLVSVRRLESVEQSIPQGH